MEKDTKTDLQIVMELREHLRAPCTVSVNDTIFNIRNFYIGEAKLLLEKMEKEGATNQGALGLLRSEILIAEEALKTDTKR